MKSGNSGRVMIGLIVVTVGVLLLLGNLGIGDFNPWNYTPSLLILLGLWALIRSGFRGSIGPWVLIGIGVAIQLSVLDEVPAVVRGAIWPVLIIAVGVLLIVTRASFGGRASAARRSGDGLNHVAVFNGINDVVDGPFDRLHSTTLFGGADYDLRRARVERPPAVIDITCMFGGVELRVPEGWTVHNDVLALFGGVDDKRRGSSADGEVTVSIRGTVLFGGLTIKD
jgi:predicted membrane protein